MTPNTCEDCGAIIAPDESLCTNCQESVAAMADALDKAHAQRHMRPGYDPDLEGEAARQRNLRRRAVFVGAGREVQR